MLGLVIGAMLIEGTGISRWCYLLLVASFLADIVLAERI